MAIEDTLKGVELFADLPDEDLRRLSKLVVQRQYKAGEIIVRENEAGVAFYVVASGRVEAVRGLGGPNEQVMATFGPEDFFGEMALFDNQVRSTSVRAIEDTECLVLTSWDFRAELQAGNCRIAIALLSVLARRIRTMNETVAH
jgi:CRP/FNR family transcriptional regulator, cyclic AMP receptor protein